MSLRDRFIAALDNIESNVKESAEIITKLTAEHKEESLVLLANMEQLGGSMQILATCVDNENTAQVEQIIISAEALIDNTSKSIKLVRERHPHLA
ncbi:hypothetical protein ACYPKM_01585 [Pseudomonas aeruginosa]